MFIRTAKATFFWLTMVVAFLGQQASGQIVNSRNLPSANYYLGFPEFYAADYGDALNHFVRGSNTGALKIGPDERFLDSLCFWTMAGECHFHLGNYAEAIQYYEQAIDLLLVHARGDWQERMRSPTGEWDASLQIQRDTSAVQRANVNWFQSQRGEAVARVPSGFRMLFGRIDAARVLVEGGVLHPPEYRKVDMGEIMRCAALAIYRRSYIKGEASQFDPSTGKIVSNLARLPIETPVFGKWNLIVRGLANMSAGKNERAFTEITNGLRFASGLDHQLTPIGLMALARIALAENKKSEALQLAMEASHSAAVYEQFDLIEESLALANSIHLSESKSVFPPLAPAVDWSSRSRTRLLQTSLLVELADCFLESDNPVEAANALARTKQTMARTDLNRSPLGTRIRYLNAAIAYQNGEDGNPLLARVLDQLQQHSLWLFRLKIVDSAYLAGSITARQAELIYDRLLIDPGQQEWLFQPMETMAYINTPHIAAMERLFEILISRKNEEKSIEVAERIRRHRFYQSLPLGGRLLALRWMLLAPDAALNPMPKLQRQQIFNQYPELRQSINDQLEIINQLRRLPINPIDNGGIGQKQRDLLVSLHRSAQNHEDFFKNIALKRQPADHVFPAQIDSSSIAKNLEPRQIVVTALRTESGYHLNLLTSQNKRSLGVIRERDLRKKVAQLYRALGISDANNAVDAAVLAKEEWREAAAELKQLVFEKLHDDQWENYDELVVVPDGLMWYIPFEILQTGDAQGEWKNLNDSVKIRYLPLLSMVTDIPSKPLVNSRYAVVTRKTHPKTDTTITYRAFEDLKIDIPNAVAFERPTKLPSNLTSTHIDSILVWHDLRTDPKSGPFGLTPFVVDQGRNGSTLGSWLRSPFQAPNQLVLPNFSSRVAAGLKSKSDGSELFLTTCGLMAAGVKSVMISRWRSGGPMELELSRRFLVHSADKPAVEALDSSAREIRSLDINMDNEIRVKPSRTQMDPFKADHPFFWAGNMVIDPVPFIAPNIDAGPADPATDDEDTVPEVGGQTADEPGDMSPDDTESTSPTENLEKPPGEGDQMDEEDSDEGVDDNDGENSED